MKADFILLAATRFGFRRLTGLNSFCKKLNMFIKTKSVFDSEINIWARGKVRVKKMALILCNILLIN